MGHTVARLDTVAHHFNNNWCMATATDKAFGLLDMRSKVAILASRTECEEVSESPVVPVAGLDNP